MRRSNRLKKRDHKLNDGNSNSNNKLSGHKRMRSTDDDAEDSIHNKRRKLDDKNEFCEWKGTYLEYKKHRLNCKYLLTKCKYCYKAIYPSQIDHHHSIYCRKYPMKCCRCGRNGIPRKDLPSHKKNYCPFIYCECLKLIKRATYKQHKDNDCLDAMVVCIYQSSGCKWKGQRKYLNAHLRDNTVKHMANVKLSHDQLKTRNNELENRVKDLEQIIKNITLRLVNLEKK